jgi:hypothetical protein
MMLNAMSFQQTVQRLAHQHELSRLNLKIESQFGFLQLQTREVSAAN